MKDFEFISAAADMELEIGSICYDSRRVEPGDVFVAIRGFKTDGHIYIEDAISRGAAVLVCEEKPDASVPYILAKNSRQALAVMSANYFGRPTEGMTMIGVTGTNGKTTTTYLLKSVIERTCGSLVGLIGTNQNMIGNEVLETERTTPESFELQELFREMADRGCTHVVMEVSSHALALSRVDGIRFHTGIFTNLTQDHLDFHETMEEYLKAKAMLFERCEYGVVNLDDQYARQIIESAKCQIKTFSLSKNEADLVAKNIRLKADKVEFEALTLGQIQRIELKIPGCFSIQNAMGVIAAALGLNISLADIASALKNTEGVKGRAEVVPTGTDYTMIIDYAHTPDALQNMLKTARKFTEGRVVTLFGCGGDRDATKRPQMGAIAAKLSDYVIVTSDNPRTEQPMAIINSILEGMKDTKTSYNVIEDRRSAIRWAMDNARTGDVIILAGKGHETYQILGETKVHLDEREEIAAHLEEIRNGSINA